LRLLYSLSSSQFIGIIINLEYYKNVSIMKDLIQKIRTFRNERDWNQFHSPKNLSTAIIVEAAELAEHFQWLTQEQINNLLPSNLRGWYALHSLRLRTREKGEFSEADRGASLRLTVAGMCVKHGNQGKKRPRFSENGTTVNN
jgi:NTP pyrophosphatase (non-canonical NTP hydrolase)